MTREEKIRFLQDLPSETISPSQLAMVIGGDPYSYNLAAKDGKIDHQVLPHIWRGRNLRFFKEAVIDQICGHKKTACGATQTVENKT